MTILYHYCGAASFKSIIEHKALWLCDTRKMNDASETVLVEQVFEDCLAERVLSADLSADLAQTIRDDYAVNRAEAFACSLSEEGDATVQWKSYADHGSGFALGFDAETLWKNTVPSFKFGQKGPFFAPIRGTPTTNTVALSSVVYCDATRLGYIKRHLDKLVKATPSGGVQDQVFLTNRVLTLASICKEASFAHEKEWRLIYQPLLNPQNGSVLVGHFWPMRWRVSKYGIAPYFEFEFKPEALKKVVLGPTNPDARQRSAEHLLALFLQAHGFSGNSITQSISPYRG